MATTKTQKSVSETKEEIVKVAMSLAAVRGWESLTLLDIAQEGGISLADLHELFEDKTDILVALDRLIDRAILSTTGEPDVDLSARDRLFDILMERYDAQNEYRAGIIAVLRSFRFDPKQAVIGLPHLCRSMNWMLEAAGVDTCGIRGAVKVAGLTGVYLEVLRVWAEDESSDLAKTMAALDKSLERAERFVNLLSI